MTFLNGLRAVDAPSSPLQKTFAPPALKTGGQQANTMIKIGPGIEIHGGAAYLHLRWGDCELRWRDKEYTAMWGRRWYESGLYVHDHANPESGRHWRWDEIRNFLIFWRRGAGKDICAADRAGV